MKTKPRGIHATFITECAYCRGEITVTNGRADFHQCPVVITTSNTTKPVTLEDIRAALGRRT
jgi:hypothetical protein